MVGSPDPCPTVGVQLSVLPSERYAIAPNSLLESLALGKPVVGADIRQIPEMLEQGVGWTFASRNTGELTGVFARVAVMPLSQFSAIGRAARNKVETNFKREGYSRAIL